MIQVKNCCYSIFANRKLFCQLFRSAHRTRSLNYLRQPAPERHPMTAGKSMLSSNLETSLTALDTFIVTRLKQTV